MEFQVRYLALFLLISVIDNFKWFWMGILHKNIQVMVLHFSYYILVTFLMMLYVILLSMLMTLLLIQSFENIKPILGEGNLIFCCTGSRENCLRSVGWQNSINNAKFQCWKWSHMEVIRSLYSVIQCCQVY